MEDVFGECGRKPWRGDTSHAREPLTMSKIKNHLDFWFLYEKCRGGQIPCENYGALPWFLVTVQKLLWRPITVQQLLQSGTPRQIKMIMVLVSLHGD